jgi:hypothetical protein
VQGRFAHQREHVTTDATSIAVDYHPFVEVEGPVRWRFGGTARGGLLYSRSAAMDLGSLELGGGGWVSAFKDLGRIRLGGGTMLQGSSSYVPSAFAGDDEGLGFLADAINDRGVQCDLAYGVTAGVDTTSRTAVIAKFLENRPLSARDERTGSWLVLTGVSYRFGLPSVNFGYRLYSATALTAHSICVQGKFDW